MHRVCIYCEICLKGGMTQRFLSIVCGALSMLLYFKEISSSKQRFVQIPDIFLIPFLFIFLGSVEQIRSLHFGGNERSSKA